ncbi:hypothetical protein V500_00770, partial [Pseudogymnoascus sp. VKM F-4518 (FW-2643)]
LQGFISDDPTSFSPLFRFLDEYGNYRSNFRPQHRASATRTFAPKFDIREFPDSYELKANSWVSSRRILRLNSLTRQHKDEEGNTKKNEWGEEIIVIVAVEHQFDDYEGTFKDKGACY